MISSERRTLLHVTLLIKFLSIVYIKIVNASALVDGFLVDHIPGAYNVVNGYVSLEQQHYTHRVVPQSHLCMDYARSIREPYSPAYWRRTNLDELNTSLPLAYWNWNGKVSWEVYNAASRSPHAIKYKIVGGKLYRDAILPTHLAGQTGRVNGTEHLLQFTLYLYPLPDMEFLVHFGDGDLPGLPLLTYTQTRNATDTGFSMPSFGVWGTSLGITQQTAYHGCLRERYPVTKRRPMAVWRGSSTGVAHPPTLENCMKLLRVRMHMLSREHPDLLDLKMYMMVQECGELLGPLFNDTVRGMPVEEFNQYCVILDADGNGWSDRFTAALVQFPTVIMKEATNLTAYAEHLYAPGVAIEQFDSGLTTLVDKVRRIVDDCQKGDWAEGQKMVHRMQATSRVLLNHIGIARSMGYSLMTYKRLTTFAPDRNVDGMKRVNEHCCGRVALPPEVVEDINRWLTS